MSWGWSLVSKARSDILAQAQAIRAATQTVAAYAPDEIAVAQPLELYDKWEADTKYTEDKLLVHEDRLYRVEQDLTSSSVYPPGSDGTLALYRPIDPAHAGTQDDPIPWVFGMDCYEGKYYSYNDKIYLCNANMKPCTWAPGTAGLWQWTEVGAA